MTEKKEIYDYLRNKQKSAEIEAKINGINLWVLFGAFAVVAWQLISIAPTNIWIHREIIIRALLLIEVIYLLGFFMAPASETGEEVRFISLDWVMAGSSSLLITNGITLIIPPALSLVFVSKNVSIFPIGLIGLISLVGLVFIIVGAISIRKQMASETTENPRLPEPRFRATKRWNTIFSLACVILFFWNIFEQSTAIWVHLELLSIDTIRSIALIATLYLLSLISLQQLLRNHSLQWTYELETDLLLESITPQIALRRIEHRALGPRLCDVMDTFFDDLDKQFSELDTLGIDCQRNLAEVSSIPIQYKAEREDRIANAMSPSEICINIILKKCDDLSDYLKKVEKQQRSSKRLAFISLLSTLFVRQKEYEVRARRAAAELKDMRTNANSGMPSSPA